MIDKLKSLHETWCSVTGQELHFKATERIFFELFKMDFTTEDLKCVLMYCIAYNKTHKHAPMKIQAHKLLGDLEVFSSILAEARAKARNAVSKPTAREVVLHEWRGVKPESNGNCRPVAEVFEALRKSTQTTDHHDH